MNCKVIMSTPIFLLLCFSVNSQSLQKPGGVDEYWSIVTVNPSTSGMDGLVPTERSRIIGIGTEELDGNSTVTVVSGGPLQIPITAGILSNQKSTTPYNFGILSYVTSGETKAFSSRYDGCETFHVLGSGHVEGKSLKIFENGWCDYVFKDDYPLLPLQDLKNYIIKNKHLPEIKCASDVNITGVLVYEMNKLLLKKIEELTLHVIAKQEELNAIRSSFGE